MLFTPVESPPSPRKIIRSPIVSTGEAANSVSSYVLTYGEIRDVDWVEVSFQVTAVVESHGLPLLILLKITLEIFQAWGLKVEGDE